MSLHAVAAFTHVALGTLALLTFWIAGAARKGSPLHKGAGKIHLLAMTGLLLPAIALTMRVLAGPQWAFGVFLSFLLILVATTIWCGWRAIRDKRDFARYTGRVYRVLAWLNVVGGAALLAFGAMRGQPVFIAFAFVGLLVGRGMLRLVKDGPQHPRWWLQEHLNAMIGNGVATHIAFLLIGLPRLIPAAQGAVLFYIAWLAPLAAAIAARWWLGRRYLPSNVPTKAAIQVPDISS